MRKLAMWAILGIVAFGLAAAMVIFTASNPPGPAMSRRLPEPFSGPSRAEGVPAPAFPAPGARPEAQPLPSVQPEGSSVVWENPDDRLQSLAAMQRQRFESGMQGLNQRAARRAAMSGAATPPSVPGRPQAAAR